jgi:hypothetical protein
MDSRPQNQTEVRGLPILAVYIRAQSAWNTAVAGQVIPRLCLDIVAKRSVPASTGDLTAVQMVSCMQRLSYLAHYNTES